MLYHFECNKKSVWKTIYIVPVQQSFQRYLPPLVDSIWAMMTVQRIKGRHLPLVSTLKKPVLKGHSGAD